MGDSAWDYAQNHPISVAAGLMVALPGAYLFLCASGLCSNETHTTESLMENITRGVSVYDTTPIHRELRYPMSKWSDEPTPTFVMRTIHATRNNAVQILTAVEERLGVDARRLWAPDFTLGRMVIVAATTVLPGAFLILVQKHPHSLASRHQTKIANTFHLLALITVAVGSQTLSIQDLLVALFAVVSFEALQSSGHESCAGPVGETHFPQTHTFVGSSDNICTLDSRRSRSPRSPLTRKHSASDPESPFLTSTGSKDAEIERMTKRLAEFKFGEKAKEGDLRRTRTELHNARSTLKETIAEYATLRDEMKVVKNTLGRDHQTVVYRKDIELFALRKANEQKEKYIKDREAKLDSIDRQHKAALDTKDAELRNFKERILFLERQARPGEGRMLSAAEKAEQAALQIKFLRVKGRNSTEVDERTLVEKDEEIARLKAELADVSVARETGQNELRRAWDATCEVQQALNEERRQHAETQAKLREAAARMEEEIKNRVLRSSPNRLPTIDENQQELEAMFNTAQQDNMRLYGEVEALEKRVREANARIFMTEQATEALREQLRLEKAINDDIETARPSIVHRVHFQRMESQLKEMHEQLDTKEEEVKKLLQAAAETRTKFDELNRVQETTSSAHVKVMEENEQLKQSLKALEPTKEQPTHDHERPARHRVRPRTISAEHTSARSSGATLITESPPPPIPPIPSEDELPLPPRPVSIATDPLSSIQNTPERFVRRDPPPPSNRVSMISNDAPPPELRPSKRKSLTLKGLMQKITRKDKEEKGKEEVPAKPVVESSRSRTSSLPRSKNASRPKSAIFPGAKESRPTTSATRSIIENEERPKTSGLLTKKETEHRRYFSESRPKTPMTEIPIAGEAVGDEGQRPKSRGWANSRKLMRRSMA